MQELLGALIVIMLGWIKLDLIMIGRKVERHETDHDRHYHKRRTDTCQQEELKPEN